MLAALDEYLYAWRYPLEGPSSIDFESIAQATFLGLPPGGLTPQDLWVQAIHPDDADAAQEILTSQLAGASGSGEYRIVGGDGATRWLRDRWTCRREEGGDIVAEGIVSDITGLREAQDDLAAALAEAQVANDELEAARLTAERASNTDPLTGLANRRSFQRALEQAVGTAATEPFGLILLDVDHFKRTNDSYGHQAGDDVLVGVVERMRTSCPAGRAARALGWRGVHGARARNAPPRCTARGRRRDPRGRPRRAPGDAAGIPRDHDLLRRRPLAQRERHRRARSCGRCGDVPRQAVGRDRTRLAGDTASEPDQPELLLLAQSFAYTASIREGVPELHCSEVADLAGAIATRLDLPAATVLRCRIAGWLHDVGMITIPDRVLAKPGPLTDEEWRVMTSHAAFGADLVARTPGIAESAGAVRHHHERWDGRGYPDRLAGTAIPLEARVVAAADTWNAMTRDRVYRPALGFEEACAEVLEISGAQLDPSIAGALMAIVRDEHELAALPQAA